MCIIRFPKANFLEYLKKALPPDIFKAFLVAAFSTKVHFLRGKRGTVVNDKCSFWYNRVGNFQASVLDRRKEIFTAVDQYAHPERTIPLQSVWSMALSAMKVGCEQCTYLLFYRSILTCV